MSSPTTTAPGTTTRFGPTGIFTAATRPPRRQGEGGAREGVGPARLRGPGFDDPHLRAVLREPDTDVVSGLRDFITGSLHIGSLRCGDRLPSVRKTAAAFGVTAYAALQAYVALEEEGLVERRERSGIYVGEMERQPVRPLPETGTWLAQVLTEACEHQLKIPRLPELIRRWTAAMPVRCTCIESCVDLRVALCLELEQQFGMEATGASIRELRLPPRAGAAAWPAVSIADADLLVTTPYHAAEARRLAESLGKPLLIATLNPVTVSSAEQRLRSDHLTVVCVDPIFGERMRGLHGGIYRDRVRVVLVEDEAALAALDRAEPVLLTPAARQAMERCDFRLISPVSPSFSLDFARKTAEMLIRINLQAQRA
jgi:DNA-binding transcriptional regulator YhcF (GntR family)